MMQRQQHGPERLQDKGDGCGLQEGEAEQPSHSAQVYWTQVERVDSYRYPGMHVSVDLTWTTRIFTLVKKVRQRLDHLRRLRKFKISTVRQRALNTAAVESVLTGSITTRYSIYPKFKFIMHS